MRDDLDGMQWGSGGSRTGGWPFPVQKWRAAYAFAAKGVAARVGSGTRATRSFLCGEATQPTTRRAALTVC